MAERRMGTAICRGADHEDAELQDVDCTEAAPIFGHPLSASQLRLLAGGSIQIPEIVHRCCCWLETNAMEFTGLYRVNPSGQKVHTPVVISSSVGR